MVLLDSNIFILSDSTLRPCTSQDDAPLNMPLGELCPFARDYSDRIPMFHRASEDSA